MIEIRRILCPTDFSETSRHALNHAAALARWYKASITLLYAHSPTVIAAYAPGVPLLPGAVLTAQDREATVQNLHDLAKEEVGDGVRIDCQFRDGDATTEILQAADALSADLLVLGTHGRSGIERLAMGSVAEKVLRRASCPVMTVPPHSGRVVPASPSFFRRILCAVDFSESSMRALAFAGSIAQEAGGQLAVMHVVELLHEEMGLESSWATQRTIADYIAAVRADSTAKLEAAVPEGARYYEVQTVVTTGKPYREILREAADRESDLIVLGVHGRNPLDLLLFGSTTQQVVRRAVCPVLTVRTDVR